MICSLVSCEESVLVAWHIFSEAVCALREAAMGLIKISKRICQILMCICQKLQIPKNSVDLSTAACGLV